MSAEHELHPQLLAWARATFSERCGVRGSRSLGGHSGVTVGFEVVDAAGAPLEALVLKVAPPGVTRQNNFDVLRQVPVLQVLERHAVPAPQARWWSGGEDNPFGAPYLMMSRLPGASLPDVFSDQAGQGLVDRDAQFGDAMRTLARIHRIPAADLQGWNAGRAVPQEIEHWVQVVHKSSNVEWVRQAMGVRELLHAHTPDDPAIGLVHGDYYSNNWVFDAGRLSGVVDWEGSSIGPVLLDLGWVCNMYDPAAWGPLRQARMGWHPPPEALVEWYAQAAGAMPPRLGWYRALAAYRLACITAYYFERHRSGKRSNPAWEVMGEAIPSLLRRAADLVHL